MLPSRTRARRTGTLAVLRWCGTRQGYEDYMSGLGICGAQRREGRAVPIGCSRQCSDRKNCLFVRSGIIASRQPKMNQFKTRPLQERPVLFEAPLPYVAGVVWRSIV